MCGHLGCRSRDHLLGRRLHDRDLRGVHWLPRTCVLWLAGLFRGVSILRWRRRGRVFTFSARGTILWFSREWFRSICPSLLLLIQGYKVRLHIVVLDWKGSRVEFSMHGDVTERRIRSHEVQPMSGISMKGQDDWLSTLKLPKTIPYDLFLEALGILIVHGAMLLSAQVIYVKWSFGRNDRHLLQVNTRARSQRRASRKLSD